MGVLWTIVTIAGVLAVLAILIIAGQFCGRGHLGNEQSRSHYLDKVEAMSHRNWM